MVVARGTRPEEVTSAAHRVRRAHATIPIVLQPVTPVRGGGPRPPEATALLLLQEAAGRIAGDVRVIPQTHKLMGQR